MKNLGLDTFALVDYYMKEVRVHLELSVPVRHSGHSCKLSVDIERVQRVAVNIMVDNTHYEQACAMLGLKQLHVLRQELCKRFAVQTASSKSKHNNLFKLEKNGTHFTRSDSIKFREHICNKTTFPLKNIE